MPTVTAQNILDRAEIILQDTTNIRWPEAEELLWLSDGVREIVLARPDSYVQTAPVALAAGTRQTIPAAGHMFIKATRNMGTGGTTPGRALRKVPMDLMDSQTPTWHTATASTTILHYMSDPRDPRAFYVYPPATAGTQVEITYAATPPAITSTSTVIPIDDIYANPLLDYVLYRAYSKDASDIGNKDRAVAHRAAFENTLGLKMKADGAVAQQDNTRG